MKFYIMKRTIITLALINILLIIPALSLAQKDKLIEFTLSTDKMNYVLGEPVIITATIRNIHADSVKIIPHFRPRFGLTKYKISKNNNKDINLTPIFYIDADFNAVSLNSGDSVSQFVPIFAYSEGPVFTEPGTYKISAEYLGIQNTNSLEIFIEPPQTEEERMASNYMLEPEVTLFMFVRGAKTLTKAQRLLAEITEKFQGTRLYPYANATMGMYYSQFAQTSKDKNQTKLELNKAINHLTSSLESDITPYYKINTYYHLINSYLKNNDKYKAIATLDKFEKVYKADKRASVYLKQCKTKIIASGGL